MNCECAICKNHKPFIMPDEILDASRKGDLVLFCGAGISTENPNVLPYTFYDSIREEMDSLIDDLPFSELMQQYCALPDGRRKLLRKIKERFDDIHSFPELERNATMFHCELAELYFIKTIITTNWDTYFENYCAATPITVPEDFLFWDESERCVLKIHGSMNNIGTIVATKEDYQKCEENLEKGIIGATLKTILANKTVVFIGFSFGDEDFAQILNYLREEMGDISPHIFVVTLDEKLSHKLSYSHCTYIVTDGTYFLHRLKLILKEEGRIVNCDSRPKVEVMAEVLDELHARIAKIDFHKYPSVVYCLAYQDGIQHAFERFLQLYSTGYYNRPGQIAATARCYSELIEGCTNKRDFWDEAYYEGYLNGLIFIGLCENDLSEAEKIPVYFLPKVKAALDSYDIFLRELKRVTKKANKYHRYALKKIDGFKGKDIVLHHPPY